jgi:hypothetical protein
MPDTNPMQRGQPLDDQSLAAYQSRPPRKRTLLSGKLVYRDRPFLPDGSFTIDCSIRDISEGGAKIVLDKRQLLPAEFFLIVVKYCTAHWARVVWLKYPARGLQFSKTYKLDAGLPDELKFIRELWGNLYVRPGTVNW